MKKVQILKIFTIAIILSILLLTIPVLPALATNDTALTPTSGKIGDSISVAGDTFTSYKSTSTYDSFAEIYFAEDNVVIGKFIDTDVKTYKMVAESDSPIDETTGDFSATFNVPSQLDDYADASYHDSVRPGTYYVYVTITKYPTSGTPTVAKNIVSKTTFTVIASAAISLSSNSSRAGTDVTISGTNFLPSYPIIFKFDSTTLQVKSGDVNTSTAGSFNSVITIPTDATVGTHTIYVTVGTTVVNNIITVTASPTISLSSNSSKAGTDVTISGTNFLPSYPIIFKFDNTTLQVKSGDANTNTSGNFTSVITIPADATATTHTISVTVGTTVVNASFTVTTSPTLNPLDPTSGPVGTQVNISGANCPPNAALAYKIDTTTLTPTTGSDVLVRSSGLFYAIITIPAGTTSGAHTISVTVGTTTLTATFTVTGATPTPTPTSKTILETIQTGNNVGATVAMAGAGFTPSANVTIKWDNTTLMTTKANADGTISVNFVVPASKGGAHNIVVTDGTNSATTNFTIETTPPPVPSLVSPAGGAKVKTPITFTWGSVTDPSSPVTYELQIATDTNFTASSIVVDEKALDKSEYTLTATEETALAGSGASNYWRVKAIDAAQNESAWTAAVAFQISVSQPLPKWAYIVIGVVGGLVVFFIGYWIGRRTAFYY